MHDFQTDAPSWQDGIIITGFHYFTYSFMKQVVNQIKEYANDKHQPCLLYPNPSSGKLTIELNKELAGQEQLLLYSSAGKFLHSIFIDTIVEISTENLPSGMYFLVSGNKLPLGKFVVQK
jgi:hypothetical protein